MRQRDPANRACLDIASIDQHAFAGAGIFIGNKAEQVTFILGHTADPRGEGCLAGIPAFFQLQSPAFARLEIMFDETGEQEPAGFGGGRINIAVLAAGDPLIDHPEFQDAVVQPLFARCPIGKIETPAMEFGLKAVLIDIGHHMAIAVLVGQRRRLGIVLEISVHHHLVTVLIGVKEVEDVSRRSVEPADLIRLAVARDQRKPARQPRVQARRMDVPFEHRAIPEQRQIVEDRPVLGKDHIVRQSRSRQWHGDIVNKLPASINHAVMHERRVFCIVEEQEFTGAAIDLGMSRNSIERNPWRNPQRGERFGIQLVGLTALVKG